MSETQWLGERYRLGEVLGHGGMSEVRRARDTRLGRNVAIKLLRADLVHDETLRERFRRRVEHAAALTHPAIVACYDTGETSTEAGTLPYLVMEYVDGRTLRRILTTGGPLRQRRALEVMADTCAALQFAHRHGVAHRTLDPSKVMIDRNGAVKVLNFDTAGEWSPRVAASGPAGAHAEAFDVRSDVYDAGRMLFELLVGAPPDSGVAPSRRNRSVGPELDSIVRTALATNPAERYGSASAMRSAMVAVLTGKPKPAEPEHQPAQPEQAHAETALLAAGPAQASTETTQQFTEPARHSPEPARRPPEARAEARAPVVVSARRRKPILLGLLGVVVVAAAVWLATSLLGSGGAKPVALPQSQGKAFSAVTAQLRQLQLTPQRHSVHCQPKTDGTPAPCRPNQVGTVLRTDPSPGAQVDPHSTVAVYVGAPAQQVAVPSDLSGKTVDEATGELRTLGLRVADNQQRTPVSDPAMVDRVVRADPGAGANIGKGSAVTLSVGTRAAPPSTSSSPPPPTTTSPPPTPPPPDADGERGENGQGTYVCTEDKLYFAGCNPDTLGQVEHYPAYDGG